MKDVPEANDSAAEPGDAAPAGTEERVRRALSEAAAAVEPAPWPAGEVLGRAARRRRNRRIAACVPLVVAVVTVASMAAGAARGPGGPHPVPAAPALRPRPATSPAVDWPAVRVVAPGSTIAFGGGTRMRLTATELCIDWNDGTGWNCRDESGEDGNQPPGTVSTLAYGYTGGMRYALLYRGAAAPARMSVTVAGHPRPATVLTLPGHPGWATGYADLPASAAPQDPSAPVVLTVWDADGRVIASLDKRR